MHCLVEFILDSLFGIISCNMILQPRKDIKDYREGDIVEAMYMGKRHPVKIIKLSGMCFQTCLVFSPKESG